MNGDQYGEEEYADISKSCPDQFVGSPRVYSLNKHNLEEFLGKKDACLVLFYDPSIALCAYSAKQMKKAARETDRKNHGYAAVNCTEERELCKNNGVESMPMFRLYARGYTVGTIREAHTFPADTMRKFVETSPVFTQSVPPPFCNAR